MPPKPFYSSQTFWAVVVSIIAFSLAKYGYKIDDSMQNRAVEIIMQIVGYVASAWAIYGRSQARQPLSLTAPNGDARKAA